MITKETISAVLPLAEDLTRKNMLLTAQVNTPLEQLINTTNVFSQGLLNTSSVSVESIEEPQELAANYEQESSNAAHNEQIDALVSQVSTVVGEHLSFARNVVLDKSNTFIARVHADIEKFDVNAISEFCVKQLDLPEPLKVMSFQNDLRSKASTTYLEPSRNFRFAEKGPQELMELVQTGSKAFDDAVTKWLAQVGTDFLTKVWLMFFTNSIGAKNIESKHFLDELDNRDTGVDTALAVFLLAQAVNTKKPEDSGMSEKELARVADEFMDPAAQKLLKTAERYGADVKSGVLISRRDTANKTVYVNRSVYLDWLRAGGKNEMLFGMLVKNILETKVEGINANIDKAAQAWDQFKAVSTTRYKNSIATQFLASLHTNFFTMLKDREQLEEEMHAETPGIIEKINEYFNEEIKSVNASDIDNVSDVCYRLMAKCRYFYTDSYKILSDMMSAMKESQSMSVKEAALVATINYIADYICDQIVNSKS